MRFLGRLPCKAEAQIDRVDLPTLAQELGDEDCTIETSARQHRDTFVGVHAGAGRCGHRSPRYTHPDVHVSRTTTCDRSGNSGCIRFQIHLASTSLVGFSRPAMSFR